MDGKIETMELGRHLETTLAETNWTRGVAAGSLLVGAVLLITGRRKSGLTVAAAGAAVVLLENPQALRDAWNSIPRYIRATQDFLVRAEDFVEELNRQGVRLRKMVVPE